jgi:hypothetical protein
MNTSGLFPLEALQTVAAERLAGDVLFNGSQSANGLPIPVIYEIKGDVQNELERAIGSIGLCVIILTPTFRLHDPTVTPTSLDGFAHMVISVFESRSMNPTGVHALSAAQNILGLMHGFPHDLAVGLGEPGMFKSDPNQDAIVLTNDAPALQYSVPLVARIQIVRPSPY